MIFGGKFAKKFSYSKSTSKLFSVFTLKNIEPFQQLQKYTGGPKFIERVVDISGSIKHSGLVSTAREQKTP